MVTRGRSSIVSNQNDLFKAFGAAKAFRVRDPISHAKLLVFSLAYSIASADKSTPSAVNLIGASSATRRAHTQRRRRYREAGLLPRAELQNGIARGAAQASRPLRYHRFGVYAEQGAPSRRHQGPFIKTCHAPLMLIKDCKAGGFVLKERFTCFRFRARVR